MSYFNDFEPQTGGASYLKWESGQTRRIRCMSKPMIFREGWIDGRPVRCVMDESLPAEVEDAKTVIAIMVHDFEAEGPALWTIPQKGIQRTLVDLANDPDYGDPRGYDLKVSRKGSGMDTSWTVLPGPQLELANKIKALYKNIRLDWDLFLKGEGSPIVQKADEVDDMPFNYGV
jgi:hypothetical protein